MSGKEFRQGLLAGLLLLIAFGLVSLIWGLAGKARVAIEKAKNVENQYRALEERKVALEGSLAVLETARGQDAAIRTAFGVARPGEEVIVVVPPATATPTTTPPWWEKLFDWF